ncbi:hypothetical protein Poli38472_010919 [Pythium oligandrum]|uniref:Uncharacterized protein n=1 Tax=Pythium oligandrum TaxID=41045 RepID=A0A8K1CFF5_PYTOL|nr:hypothetical protein Poli38472_010919 [Pythium oligandrum]|eukprot:TMW61856.1 hypothetical protein Poli38472_010919 [Pythium oligandrum]
MRLTIWSVFISFAALWGPAQSADESIVCPSNARDADQLPAVISTCETVCGSSNLCVYYPYEYRDRCTRLVGNQCMRGDECTYECFQAEGEYIYTYKTPDDLVGQLTDGMLSHKTMPLVNVSVVNQWNADLTTTYQILVKGRQYISWDDDYRKVGPFVQLPEPYDFEFSSAVIHGDPKSIVVTIDSVRCPTFDVGSKAFPVLQCIFLVNCGLTEFPYTSASLPLLGVVSIGHNLFGKIPDFPSSSLINYLDLSGNEISMDDLSNLSPNLTNLTVGRVGWTQIPTMLSTIFPGLQELNLKNNPIEQLDPSELPSTLTTLVLNGTKIATIDEKKWSSNLTVINITHSELKDFTFNACTSNPTRRIRNLGNNRLTTIGTTIVEQLYLDHNAFETFSDALKFLNLRGNKLTTVPEAILNIESLQILDLRENPIRKYVPSKDMLNQLVKIPVLLMDADQFRGNCKYTVQLKSTAH